jgi:hypothetical protein
MTYRFAIDGPDSAGYLELHIEGDEANLTPFLTVEEGIKLFELLEEKLGPQIFARRVKETTEQTTDPEGWPNPYKGRTS